MEQSCPSCGSKGLSPFYEVRNVPVHSCLAMPSKQEALRISQGDIVLGFCEECGFIFNIAFDPSMLDYSVSYEDQQCFSPTFNSFAKGLANRLIERYNLYDKDILEIGCGKGDFLTLLCKLGHNRGVGIDPAIAEERILSEASNRLTFIKDYYSQRYADYHGDLICCRHTLEHIHNTASFLTTVRHAIGHHLNTIVFFEVPDVTRILRESAFWDIYYEHCSYFTAGSLARLFRSCKFEVLDLSRGFDDQYLLIEAKPVERESEKVHELEESVGKTAKDVKYFSKRYAEKLGQWRKLMQEVEHRRRRTVVWGSGSKCVSIMTALGVKEEIEYVVDINPHLHGKFLPGIGKKIVAPEFLKEYRPDLVIVMNPVYRKEIRRMLEEMEVAPEVIAVE